MLPPLRAIGAVHVEIYGPLPGSAKWDEAVWDQSIWSVFDWMDVTPQSMNVRVAWGSDDPTGVLSIPAAGSWIINTYDPDRKLDPSNGQSPYATSLRPGKAIRLTYTNSVTGKQTVRKGLIDEIDYDLTERTGQVRGTDLVQLVANAGLPANLTGVPNTLRARAQYLVNLVGLGSLIPVEILPTYVENVVNGNFDTSINGWSAPSTVMWLAVPPSGGPGGACLRITGNGGNYPQTVQSIPVVPGASYTFTGWGRAASTATNQARMRLDGYDDTDTNSVVSGVVNLVLPLSLGLWQKVTSTFTVPANVSYLHILMYHDGASIPVGAIWDFDAISLMGPQPTDMVDPPVGPVIASEASVWTHILTAALDALYAVWLDRDGIMRFRSFGNPQDKGFQIGGADGIPVATMKTNGSLQAVYTHIIAFDDGAPTVPVEAIDDTKRSIYGDITLKREAIVPDARVWVDSVLADRSGASLQYTPGTLYPQTEDALESILDLGMIDIAHLVVETVTPTVDVAARVLGGAITADTGTGWSAELLTYIPATEWEEAEQPTPPIIIPPEPPTTVQVVRTYACTKDSRLAHSSSLDAGNGLDINLPIGWISPYRNRAVLGFNSIPFAGVVSIVKAELLVTIGATSCGAFGSDPKVQVSRLTGSFNEGTYDVNCGFGTSNAVKYPGPAITSSGAVTTSVPKSTGSAKSIDITGIAQAWMGGQPQHGLMVKSAGEDTSKYTTCFYSRHHGTAGNRPSLRLTLMVTV